MFEGPKRQIEVALSDGTTLLVEAASIGEQEVGFADRFAFSAITKVLTQLSTEIANAARLASPGKLSVKFGLEAAIKSGELTAILVEGSAKANIEVTLEWTKT